MTPRRQPRPSVHTRKTGGTRPIRAPAPVAGPSSKPASYPPKKNGRKAQKDVEEVVDDDTQKDVTVVVDSDDDEPQMIKETITRNKGKAPQGRAARTTSKPSGKAKADSRAVEHVADGDVMDVDEVEVVEDEAPAQRTSSRNSRANKVSKPMPPEGNSKDVDSALRKELDRLRKQITEVTSQRDKLSEQLEELFRIRHTEPEEMLAQQTAHYEARLQTQQTLLDEQSKLIAASSSTRPYMLHFLSREAADEEKKDLEKEVARWREVAKQKDVSLIEKDQRIADVLHEKSTLQAELKAEVERSKSLANKTPAPVAIRQAAKRGAMSDVSDPKLSAVFALYEDVTNLLVLKVRLDKSPFPNVEEKVFDCIFTAPLTPPEQGNSLHFTLRSMYEKMPDVDPSLPLQKQLMAKMQFEPLDLGNERPEYVERLDFFKEPFVFQYDQLHVFLKSLSDRFPTPEENEGEEADQPEAIE